MSFCMDLWLWTHRPLENFDHYIPVYRDDDVEGEGCDDEEEEAENDDVDSWFLRPDEVDSEYL